MDLPENFPMTSCKTQLMNEEKLPQWKDPMRFEGVSPNLRCMTRKLTNDIGKYHLQIRRYIFLGKSDRDRCAREKKTNE